MHFTIPKELAHLKTDSRGYPIPFFVPYINGEPDFRRMDQKKQLVCINEKRCPICGLKLPKDYFYFLGGPIGMKNGIASDPAMHRHCAEFSLTACPHLVYQKAERKASGGPNEPYGIMEKPESIMLIKSSKFKLERKPGGATLIRFNVVSFEEYIYIDNKLVKKLSLTNI